MSRLIFLAAAVGLVLTVGFFGWGDSTAHAGSYPNLYGAICPHGLDDEAEVKSRLATDFHPPGWTPEHVDLSRIVRLNAGDVYDGNSRAAPYFSMEVASNNEPTHASGPCREPKVFAPLQEAVQYLIDIVGEMNRSDSVDLLVYRDGDNKIAFIWLNCGNYTKALPTALGSISGVKFEDTDADGSKDADEPGLGSWTINLTGPVSGSTVTSSSGAYSFNNLPAGEYTITEELQPGWVQSLPPSGAHNMTVPASGGSFGGRDFGNYQLAEIHGQKFDDHDADGVKDPGEEGLGGWTIVLDGTAGTGASVHQETITDVQGNYWFTSLVPGQYDVSEEILDDSPPWLQTAPGGDGRHYLTLSSGEAAEDIDFGNIQLAEKHGKKFYDANLNGLDDDGQVVEGWKLVLTGTDLRGDAVGPLVTYTDADGLYSFTELLPGDYVVTEVRPNDSWVPTTPTSIEQTLAEGQIIDNDNFGNVCLGAGGGHTPGFWSNKNGQAAMNDGGSMEAELALLRSLNLRNPDGSNFDPTSYAEFRLWLLMSDAVNMAYKLSVHLASMSLNIEAGFVDGSHLVYAPSLLPFAPVPGLDALGFISVNDLFIAANTELLLHGSTPAGSEFRNYQEALKEPLDAANSDENFLQDEPCPFSSPY